MISLKTVDGAEICESPPKLINVGVLVEQALLESQLRKHNVLTRTYTSTNATVDNFSELIQFTKIRDVSGLAALWRAEPGFEGRRGYSSIIDYRLTETGVSEAVPQLEAIANMPTRFPMEYATVREGLGLLVSQRASFWALLRKRHRFVMLGRDMFTKLGAYAILFYLKNSVLHMERIELDQKTMWLSSDLFIVRA